MSQSSTESSIPPSSQIPPLSSSMDYYDPPQRHRHIHHPSTPNSQMSTHMATLNPPPLLSHSSTLSQASTAAYSIRGSPDAEERPSSPYSSRDSPPLSMIMSTTNTPIVPPSGANPQYNPFPGSPSIAASTAGSKRTASGTVKNTFPNSASSVPNSPATPVTPRFARMHTGIDASPKNVSQISTQLRTRLTYALLKLENNWTTESLDQVEARISQGQHPTSPSPRVHIKREPSAGDEHSGAFDSIRRHTRTSSEPNTAHPLSAGGSNRTYESFWRDHQVNPIRAKILQAKAASQALGTSTSTHIPHSAALMSHAIHRGGLQPPAQIIPDRDRRSQYNPPRHPPALTPSGSNLSTYSNYSTASSLASMVANTPPPAGAAAQRTMEQDAVESLMFLSSPGNSRPSSQQTISSVHTSQNSQHSQHSQPPVATFHPSPSSSQNPSRVRHNYARNATTWPRDRPRHKQARLGLDTIGVAIGPGVQEEDDATDEETGPDSVNARVGGGIHEGGSKLDDISFTGRSARHRGDTGGVLSRVHGRGGRNRMGGGGSNTAAAASPGARGVAGVGGY